MKYRRPERKADQSLYTERSQVFIREHPICAVVLFFKGIEVGTNQTHHCKRNIGSLLLDQRFWLAVSTEGHDLCERVAPMQCRMLGFNLSRNYGINDALEFKVLEKRRNLDFGAVEEYDELMKAIYPEYIKL